MKAKAEAWSSRRTFHELNLIRIKADPNIKPAELIQTPILIPAELSSKGGKFGQTAHKIHYLQVNALGE